MYSSSKLFPIDDERFGKEGVTSSVIGVKFGMVKGWLITSLFYYCFLFIFSRSTSHRTFSFCYDNYARPSIQLVRNYTVYAGVLGWNSGQMVFSRLPFWSSLAGSHSFFVQKSGLLWVNAGYNILKRNGKLLFLCFTFHCFALIGFFAVYVRFIATCIQ